MCRYALAAVVSFVAIGARAMFVHPFPVASPEFATMTDPRFYYAIATGGPDALTHYAPFCWRLLTPLLWRVLPMDADTAIRLVAFVALWATALALYALCRAHGIRPVVAMLAPCLFASLHFAVEDNLANPYRVDMVAYLLIVLALWAVRAKHDAAFAALLLLGALNKEVVLFVIPVWFCANEPRRWQRGVLLILPAVAATIALRLLIVPVNDYSAFSVMRGILAHRAAAALPLAAYTVAPFGVVLLLAVFAPRANWRLVGVYLPYVALVYAQLLLASDTERLIVYAFPIVVVAACNAVEVRLSRARIRARIEQGQSSQNVKLRTLGLDT